MATAVASATEGQNGHDHILRPRAVKPGHPQVLRTRTDESMDGPTSTSSSTPTSGRATPVPEDAPPSTQVISSARKQIRDQRRRLFPTIAYASRVSHFDPSSDYHDFKGFFVLFWIALAIMAITTMLRNIKDTGYPMRVEIWTLFTVKIWELALVDLLMVTTTAISLPLHYVFRTNTGILRWSKAGMYIQSLFQAFWFSFWVTAPFYLEWTWTAQVFLTLHTFTLLMKMHSWAFYNGHLAETKRRLQALDNPSTASKAPAYQYPRRASLAVTELTSPTSLAHKDEDSLSQLRETLAFELTSPLGGVTYPQNLTWANYGDYLLCPTLCYELEYPRTKDINWASFGWKVLAVFGVISLLTVTSEEFILPVLNESEARLASPHSLSETGLILAETISMLLFPFMISFLLTFMVIFEYVLGAFAEITRFADRHFYSDWWNSTDWLEFSREWNVPVHHFFLRHVYSASRPHIGKQMATLITFLISAIGHEIVMGCITKKIRGYGFIAQMSQLPLFMIQNTRWVKGKRLLNNILFWCSMILGLSMICSLYVLI